MVTFNTALLCIYGYFKDTSMQSVLTHAMLKKSVVPLIIHQKVTNQCLQNK